jgi:hypothetical protein
LRKSFLVAATAALVFGVTGVAQAQNPAPTVDVSASFSPTKAGTKSKPKNEKLTLTIKNSEESKTTASKIEVTLPSTLKLSTKGLTQCTESDAEIIETLGRVCNSAKAGSGSANAVILANGTKVVFKVTPFVGKNEMLFLLTSEQVENKYVVHGKIKGRKMTITIGPDVQQPVAGLYTALIDIKTTLSKKKGSNYLFSSNGCKSKKHKVDVKVTYVPNPTPPAATTASDSTDARCS